MAAFIVRALVLANIMIVVAAGTAQASPRFTEADVRCLAENIAYEAPSEPYQGKLAVATVTMNRVKSSSFPKTVCDVVYQRSSKGCQFSWVCQKRRSINPVLYAQTEHIARRVLFLGLREPMIGNALFYHATYVSPTWSRERRFIAQIGAHIFYA